MRGDIHSVRGGFGEVTSNEAGVDEPAQSAEPRTWRAGDPEPEDFPTVASPSGANEFAHREGGWFHTSGCTCCVDIPWDVLVRQCGPLSEVLADPEAATCNGSGLIEDAAAPTSEFNFRGPHDTIGEPPPKPCPGCINCAKVLADQPKPRVFPQGSFEPEGVEAVTDEDGFRWIRAGRATRIQHYWRRAGLGVMGSLVLWTRLNRRPLSEVLADSEEDNR